MYFSNGHFQTHLHQKTVFPTLASVN